MAEATTVIPHSSDESALFSVAGSFPVIRTRAIRSELETTSPMPGVWMSVPLAASATKDTMSTSKRSPARITTLPLRGAQEYWL